MALPLLAPLISGAASIFGGMLEKKGAEDQNQAQIASAREQMDFQERMSNTSHQRQVDDLRKAGLNPILSSRLGGASSPGGAQPNIVNTMAGLGNSARSVGDKMYNFNVQKETVQNMSLQNDLLKEQIQQAQINNARSGLLTPAYDKGGELINKIVSGIDRLVGDRGGDIMKDVGDLVSPAGTENTPSSARAVVRRVLENSPIAGSEASKFIKGEKGFIKSLKDANPTKANKLTEEDIKRYGLRHGYNQYKAQKYLRSKYK